MHTVCVCMCVFVCCMCIAMRVYAFRTIFSIFLNRQLCYSPNLSGLTHSKVRVTLANTQPMDTFTAMDTALPDYND